MFDAWHVATGKGYAAYEAWSTFQNPNEEKWYCCPIHQMEVVPIRMHMSKSKHGKEFVVREHFNMKNKGDECSSAKGESERHRQLKMLVARMMIEGKITFISHDIEIPIEISEFKEVPHLKYHWEQARDDHRADVLFEFKKLHPALGWGIDIEVQLSRMSDEEKRQREDFWIGRGISLAWITKDMLTNDDEDEGFTRDTIDINCLWFFEFQRILKDEIVKYTNVIKSSRKKITRVIKSNKKRTVNMLRSHRKEILNVIETSKTEFDSIREELKKLILDTRERFVQDALVDLKQEAQKEFEYLIILEKEIEESLKKTCRSCLYSGPISDQFRKDWQEGMMNCWYNNKNKIDKHPDPTEPMGCCTKWTCKIEGG